MSEETKTLFPFGFVSADGDKPHRCPVCWKTASAAWGKGRARWWRTYSCGLCGVRWWRGWHD